ncbi:CD225/dispanin family protein [Isoptericola sp. NPDC019693]|uniref:CD225/dispanin family protein n=1 Tax=Isoptericola sp. NPDC019693 TaxID=3364009 RepID=UPI0037BDE120
MTPYAPPAPTAAPPGATRHATGWAVAAAVLCWPLGIAALLGAQRSARAHGAGDLAAAAGHARAARRYGIAAVVVAVVLSVLLTAALLALLLTALVDLGWPHSVPAGSARG